MPTEIHVFDFDGTLFRSPVPNPKNHSPVELGRLKSTGGWFHLPPSLCHPAVPDVPGEEWWIPYIREKAREVLKTEGAKAVLLTGRGLLFTERVKEITRTQELHFDEYLLKPPGHQTIDWKKSVITGLLDKHPTARKLFIYEDRVRHVAAFRGLCETLRESHNLDEHDVVHVQEPEVHLDDDVEQHVVTEMQRMLLEMGSDSAYAQLLRGDTPSSSPSPQSNTRRERDLAGLAKAGLEQHQRTVVEAALSNAASFVDLEEEELVLSGLSQPEGAAVVEELKKRYPQLDMNWRVEKDADAAVSDIVLTKRSTPAEGEVGDASPEEPAQAPTEIHVFDFDGTLFRSPVPNPKNHSPAHIGRLKGDGGWFHLPPSLCHPAVPDVPGEEWWIPYIREKAREVLKTEGAKAVLLTGRGVLFTKRVKEITHTQGLDFDEYHLKPPGQTTMKWKKSVITGLLDKHPTARKLFIYDDRVRHVAEFRVLCEQLRESHNLDEHDVVHVQEPEVHLDDDVEQHVIREMGKMLLETGSDSTYAQLLRGDTPPSNGRERDFDGRGGGSKGYNKGFKGKGAFKGSKGGKKGGRGSKGNFPTLFVRGYAEDAEVRKLFDQFAVVKVCGSTPTPGCTHNAHTRPRTQYLFHSNGDAKQFCFVQLQTQEVAQAAMEQLDGRALSNGKTLTVNLSD